MGRVCFYNRATSVIVLLAFTLSTVIATPSNFVFAQSVPVGTLNFQIEPQNVIQSLVIPENLGYVQEVFLPGGDLRRGAIYGVQDQEKGVINHAPTKRLILYLQDAHTNYDSETNIRQLIQLFQKNYGVPLVLLEGGAGRLDSLFFRSFPNADLKKKVIDEYVKQGELSGGEIASILNEEFDTAYYGIENQSLYDENKKTFLEAVGREGEIINQLGRIKSDLERKAKQYFSPETESFYSHQRDFRNDVIDLMRYVKDLVELWEESSQRSAVGSQQTLDTGHQTPEKGKQTVLGKEQSSAPSPLMGEGRDGGEKEMPPTLILPHKGGGDKKDFSTVFPELAKVLTAGDNETKLQGPEYDIATNKLIEEFDIKVLPLLSTDEQIEMGQMIQMYRTGQIASGALLNRVEEVLHEKNMAIDIPEILKPAATHAKTLESIKGTKLFSELSELEKALRNSLPKSEEEKNVLWNLYYVELLKSFAKLELVQEDWEELQASRRTSAQEHKGQSFTCALMTCALVPSAEHLDELFQPHYKFYELATKRDEALYENALAMMEKNKTNFAVIVTGGFHAQGITGKLKESKVPYVLVAPKINQLGSKDIYLNAMRGKMSYMRYFKGSLWDALAKDYSAKLAASLKESELTPSLKRWRDRIIQDSIAEGKVSEAGSYTKYVDALVQALRQGYGNVGAGLKPAPTFEDPFLVLDLRSRIEEELNSMMSTYFEKLKALTEKKVEVFGNGISEMWKTGNVTKESVTALVNRVNAVNMSNIAAQIAIIRETLQVVQKPPASEAELGRAVDKAIANFKMTQPGVLEKLAQVKAFTLADMDPEAARLYQELKKEGFSQAEILAITNGIEATVKQKLKEEESRAPKFDLGALGKPSPAVIAETANNAAAAKVRAFVDQEMAKVRPFDADLLKQGPFAADQVTDQVRALADAARSEARNKLGELKPTSNEAGDLSSQVRPGPSDAAARAEARAMIFNDIISLNDAIEKREVALTKFGLGKLPAFGLHGEMAGHQPEGDFWSFLSGANFPDYWQNQFRGVTKRAETQNLIDQGKLTLDEVFMNPQEFFERLFGTVIFTAKYGRKNLGEGVLPEIYITRNVEGKFSLTVTSAKERELSKVMVIDPDTYRTAEKRILFLQQQLDLTKTSIPEEAIADRVTVSGKEQLDAIAAWVEANKSKEVKGTEPFLTEYFFARLLYKKVLDTIIRMATEDLIIDTSNPKAAAPVSDFDMGAIRRTFTDTAGTSMIKSLPARAIPAFKIPGAEKTPTLTGPGAINEVRRATPSAPSEIAVMEKPSAGQLQPGETVPVPGPITVNWNTFQAVAIQPFQIEFPAGQELDLKKLIGNVQFAPEFKEIIPGKNLFTNGGWKNNPSLAPKVDLLGKRLGFDLGVLSKSITIEAPRIKLNARQELDIFQAFLRDMLRLFNQQKIPLEKRIIRVEDFVEWIERELMAGRMFPENVSPLFAAIVHFQGIVDGVIQQDGQRDEAGLLPIRQIGEDQKPITTDQLIDAADALEQPVLEELLSAQGQGIVEGFRGAILERAIGYWGKLVAELERRGIHRSGASNQQIESRRPLTEGGDLSLAPTAARAAEGSTLAKPSGEAKRAEAREEEFTIDSNIWLDYFLDGIVDRLGLRNKPFSILVSGPTKDANGETFTVLPGRYDFSVGYDFRNSNLDIMLLPGAKVVFLRAETRNQLIEPEQSLIKTRDLSSQVRPGSNGTAAGAKIQVPPVVAPSTPSQEVGDGPLGTAGKEVRPWLPSTIRTMIHFARLARQRWSIPRLRRALIDKFNKEDPEFRKYGQRWATNVEGQSKVDYLFLDAAETAKTPEEEKTNIDHMSNRLGLGGQVVFASAVQQEVEAKIEQFRGRNEFTISREVTEVEKTVFGFPVPGSQPYYYASARRMELPLAEDSTITRHTNHVILEVDKKSGQVVVAKYVPELKEMEELLSKRGKVAPGDVPEQARLRVEEQLPGLLVWELRMLDQIQKGLRGGKFERFTKLFPRPMGTEEGEIAREGKPPKKIVIKLSRTWLRDGGQKISQLDFAIQLMELVEALYSIGISVNDLRGDNIAVTPDGVGVVDLGSATIDPNRVGDNPILKKAADQILPFLMDLREISAVQSDFNEKVVKVNGKMTSPTIEQGDGDLGPSLDLFAWAKLVNNPLGKNPDLLVKYDPESEEAKRLLAITEEMQKEMLAPANPKQPKYNTASDVFPDILEKLRAIKADLARPGKSSEFILKDGKKPVVPSPESGQTAQLETLNPEPETQFRAETRQTVPSKRVGRMARDIYERIRETVMARPSSTMPNQVGVFFRDGGDEKSVTDLNLLVPPGNVNQAIEMKMSATDPRFGEEGRAYEVGQEGTNIIITARSEVRPTALARQARVPQGFEFKPGMAEKVFDWSSTLIAALSADLLSGKADGISITATKRSVSAVVLESFQDPGLVLQLLMSSPQAFPEEAAFKLMGDLAYLNHLARLAIQSPANPLPLAIRPTPGIATPAQNPASPSITTVTPASPTSPKGPRSEARLVAESMGMALPKAPPMVGTSDVMAAGAVARPVTFEFPTTATRGVNRRTFMKYAGYAGGLFGLVISGCSQIANSGEVAHFIVAGVPMRRDEKTSHLSYRLVFDLLGQGLKTGVKEFQVNLKDLKAEISDSVKTFAKQEKLNPDQTWELIEKTSILISGALLVADSMLKDVPAAGVSASQFARKQMQDPRTHDLFLAQSIMAAIPLEVEQTEKINELSGVARLHSELIDALEFSAWGEDEGQTVKTDLRGFIDQFFQDVAKNPDEPASIMAADYSEAFHAINLTRMTSKTKSGRWNYQLLRYTRYESWVQDPAKTPGAKFKKQDFRVAYVTPVMRIGPKMFLAYYDLSSDMVLVDNASIAELVTRTERLLKIMADFEQSGKSEEDRTEMLDRVIDVLDEDYTADRRKVDPNASSWKSQYPREKLHEIMSLVVQGYRRDFKDYFSRMEDAIRSHAEIPTLAREEIGRRVSGNTLIHEFEHFMGGQKNKVAGQALSKTTEFLRNNYMDEALSFLASLFPSLYLDARQKEATSSARFSVFALTARTVVENRFGRRIPYAEVKAPDGTSNWLPKPPASNQAIAEWGDLIYAINLIQLFNQMGMILYEKEKPGAKKEDFRKELDLTQVEGDTETSYWERMRRANWILERLLASSDEEVENLVKRVFSEWNKLAGEHVSPEPDIQRLVLTSSKNFTPDIFSPVLANAEMKTTGIADRTKRRKAEEAAMRARSPHPLSTTPIAVTPLSERFGVGGLLGRSVGRSEARQTGVGGQTRMKQPGPKGLRGIGFAMLSAVAAILPLAAGCGAGAAIAPAPVTPVAPGTPEAPETPGTPEAPAEPSAIDIYNEARAFILSQGAETIDVNGYEIKLYHNYQGDKRNYRLGDQEKVWLIDGLKLIPTHLLHLISQVLVLPTESWSNAAASVPRGISNLGELNLYTNNEPAETKAGGATARRITTGARQRDLGELAEKDGRARMAKLIASHSLLNWVVLHEAQHLWQHIDSKGDEKRKTLIQAAKTNLLNAADVYGFSYDSDIEIETMIMETSYGYGSRGSIERAVLQAKLGDSTFLDFLLFAMRSHILPGDGAIQAYGIPYGSDLLLPEKWSVQVDGDVIEIGNALRIFTTPDGWTTRVQLIKPYENGLTAIAEDLSLPMQLDTRLFVQDILANNPQRGTLTPLNPVRSTATYSTLAELSVAEPVLGEIAQKIVLNDIDSRGMTYREDLTGLTTADIQRTFDFTYGVRRYVGTDEKVRVELSMRGMRIIALKAERSFTNAYSDGMRFIFTEDTSAGLLTMESQEPSLYPFTNPPVVLPFNGDSWPIPQIVEPPVTPPVTPPVVPPAPTTVVDVFDPALFPGMSFGNNMTATRNDYGFTLIPTSAENYIGGYRKATEGWLTHIGMYKEVDITVQSAGTVSFKLELKRDTIQLIGKMGEVDGRKKDITVTSNGAPVTKVFQIVNEFVPIDDPDRITLSPDEYMNVFAISDLSEEMTVSVKLRSEARNLSLEPTAARAETRAGDEFIGFTGQDVTEPAFWADFWKDGKASSLPEKYRPDVAKLFAEFFGNYKSNPSQIRILDIGTGNFFVPKVVREVLGSNAQISAIDAAELSPDKVPSFVDFRQMNFETLQGFQDETLDVVTSLNAWEYADLKEQALREIYRVLVPGGKAMFLVHHRNSVILNDVRAHMQAMSTVMKKDALSLPQAVLARALIEKAVIYGDEEKASLAEMVRQSGFKVDRLEPVYSQGDLIGWELEMNKPAPEEETPPVRAETRAGVTVKDLRLKLGANTTNLDVIREQVRPYMRSADASIRRQLDTGQKRATKHFLITELQSILGKYFMNPGVFERIFTERILNRIGEGKPVSTAEELENVLISVFEEFNATRSESRVGMGQETRGKRQEDHMSRVSSPVSHQARAESRLSPIAQGIVYGSLGADEVFGASKAAIKDGRSAGQFTDGMRQDILSELAKAEEKGKGSVSGLVETLKGLKVVSNDNVLKTIEAEFSKMGLPVEFVKLILTSSVDNAGKTQLDRIVEFTKQYVLQQSAGLLEKAQTVELEMKAELTEAAVNVAKGVVKAIQEITEPTIIQFFIPAGYITSDDKTTDKFREDFSELAKTVANIAILNSNIRFEFISPGIQRDYRVPIEREFNRARTKGDIKTYQISLFPMNASRDANVVITDQVQTANAHAAKLAADAYVSGGKIAYQGLDRVTPVGLLLAGMGLLSKKDIDGIQQVEQNIFRGVNANAFNQFFAMTLRLVLEEAAKDALAKAA